MPIKKISIENYIVSLQNNIVLDVRSEGEYQHAHLPNAISLPLFNNEERAKIGTYYKQVSKQKAIKQGLQYFGPNLIPIIEKVEKLQNVTLEKSIVVYCARGGMRSAAVCWLLNLYGYEVIQIVGGYKAFRNFVLQQFTKPYPFKIIGGYTGSAKTEVLQELELQNKNIIDLEALAHHKGSAFGAINMPEQPSQEMFENKLALELFAKKQNTIFIEDESQRIGRVNIPHLLWANLRKAQILFLDVPFEKRLEHIVEEYGVFSTQELSECVERIRKNLGGGETNTALEYLQQNKIKECFAILLKYYDKYYLMGLQKRENWESLKINIPTNTIDKKINCKKILEINGE